MHVVQLASALLVGIQTAGAINVQLPVQLPVVPKVTYAGSDGLPELPDVTGDFDATVNEVSLLQAELQKAQDAGHARLSKEKADYDERLKKQERENQKLEQENRELASQILALKKSSDELLNKVHTEAKSNDFRRKELKTIQGQLKDAETFVDKALTMSDTRRFHELAFLKASPKTSKTSFLELQAREADKEADLSIRLDGGVVQMSHLMDSLQAKTKKSEDKLKMLFEQRFKEGFRRHTALHDQQSKLKKTLQTLTDFQARLLNVEASLLTTKAAFEDSLHSVGVFLKAQ